METKTFYEILQCDQSATSDELKQSYHNLILKHHPDKNDTKSQSIEFIEINTAWETLRNASKRKVYDAELLQAEFNEKPIVYESLKKTDFHRNPETNASTYSCRCGGLYHLPEDLDEQQLSGDYYIGCDECSLVVELMN